MSWLCRVDHPAARCNPAFDHWNPNQIVAVVYSYGNGHEFYSTIPLGFYSADQLTTTTSAEIQTLCGNLQYGMDLPNPICFGRQALIATPIGARPVENLHLGRQAQRNLNRRAHQEIACLCPDLRLCTALARQD